MRLATFTRSGLLLAVAASVAMAPGFTAEEDDDFRNYLLPRQSPLVTIQPKSYIDLIERLALVRKRFNDGEEIEVPRVTVNMESGRQFTGYLLGVSPRGGDDRTVLMEVYEPGQHFAKARAAFINIDEIDAVIVHRAEDDEVRSALSFDDSWLARKPSPPTRLEIRRKQVKFGKFLAGKLGKNISYEADLKAIPQDNAALQSLATAMSEMTGALVDLSSDPDVKEKLAMVKTVRFIQEQAPALEINEGVLIEGLNLSEGRNGRPNRREIRALIKKVLGVPAREEMTPAPDEEKDSD